MNKYPNGYLPKVTYWADKVAEAKKSNDTEKVDYCCKKLRYFIGRFCDNDEQLADTMYRLTLQNLQHKQLVETFTLPNGDKMFAI
jgi:hypothetical protein